MIYIILFIWYAVMTGCEIGTCGKSGHCLDNVPCNPTTGHCDNGCA